MTSEGIDELVAGDAALLDALYDDDARDGGLDDAQRTTLAGWRDVRGVVRHAREQGFDVEAPAAGTRGSMEMLMAAARAHAVAPKPGLWARFVGWLAPIVAHPAMAGAAALVVVGGAAGVLYLKGHGKVVRPPAAEHEPAPPRSPTISSPSIEGDLGDALDKHVTGDRPGPAPTTAGNEGERGPAGDDGQKNQAIGHGTGSAHASGGAKHLARPERTEPVDLPKTTTAPRPGVEGRFEALPAEHTLEESTGSVDGVTGGGEAESPPVVEPQTAPPPPPPPPPVVVARPPSRPAQIASDDEGSRAPVPSTRAQAIKLTDEARTAAKAGDCAKVTARSQQVAKLDAAYHSQVFVRDPDIAKCR